MESAFKWYETNKAETEADYGYTSIPGKCKTDESKGVTNDKGYVNVAPRSSSGLMASIEAGPTSVAIEASGFVFQSY